MIPCLSLGWAAMVCLRATPKKAPSSRAAKKAWASGKNRLDFMAALS